MVLIELPENLAAAGLAIGNEDVDSEAVTREGIAAGTAIPDSGATETPKRGWNLDGEGAGDDGLPCVTRPDLFESALGKVVVWGGRI